MKTVMNYSRLLNYINNYFEKLNTFQKVEMYLIPIILALLLVYNFPHLQKKVITNITNVSQDVYYFEMKKQKVLKKINSVHNIKVVKDIQKYAKYLNIQLTALKVVKKNISLEVKGSLKSLLHFINFSENYNDFTKVENLILTKLNDSDELELFVDISFSKIIRTVPQVEITNKINMVDNPFSFNVPKPLPKLYAIVNNHVLINNNWLTLNDTFDGYKIIKINIDSIELKSNENVSKIGLFDEK